MRLTFLLVLVVILSGGSLMGQKVIDITHADAVSMGEGLPVSTFGGEPFASVKFVRVTQGTPFFDEKWMRATLVLRSGKAYKNLLVRLNLVDNSVNYKDETGVERVASTPLKFILLSDTISGASFSFIHGTQLELKDKNLQQTWFQILLNDKISLCKQLKKMISETNPYGSATAEQIIDTHAFYFVRINDDFIPVKKWEDLQNLFKDKKDQLTSYISANHLKGRSEADFIQLVKYYNSLQQGQSTKR